MCKATSDAHGVSEIIYKSQRCSTLYNIISLFRVCDKMEKIYSGAIFCKFILAMISICVSTTCFTIDLSQAFGLTTYFSGHILELLMYCYLGNELLAESQNVADAAFQCGWHLKYDTSYNYIIRMVIMRAQKQQRLTALGFIEMSFRSFMKVRLIFLILLNIIITNVTYILGVEIVLFLFHSPAIYNEEDIIFSKFHSRYFY